LLLLFVELDRGRVGRNDFFDGLKGPPSSQGGVTTYYTLMSGATESDIRNQPERKDKNREKHREIMKNRETRRGGKKESVWVRS
jgi:hypothetical protein